MKITQPFLKVFLALVFCALVFSLFYINSNSTQIANAPNEDTLMFEPTIIASALKKAALEDSIVNFALKYLGTPYVYGACSKDGFDCSGFVYFVFQKFDIEVPRSSSQYNTFGKTIPKDKLHKGDILVFLSPTRNEIGHLGIVTKIKGKSIQFIHASSGSEMQVMLSDLNTTGYKKRFVKAIRVI